MNLTEAVHCFNNQIDFQNELPYDGFPQLLKDQLENENEFLTFYFGPKKRTEYTFRDYSRTVLRVAQTLSKDHGITGQSRVLVSMGNSPQTLIVFGALLYIGATIIPLGPSETVDRLNYILEDSEPSLIISSDELSGESSDLAYSGSEIVVDRKWFESTGDLRPEPSDLPTKSSLDSVALIIYTSGTTGQPKGVVLRQKNLFINSEALGRIHNMGSYHAHMCVLPLHHVNGFHFSFFTCLYRSTKLVLNRQFHAKSFWTVADRENVHVVSVSPFVLRELLEEFQGSFEDPPDRLDYLVSASSYLPSALLESFIDRFGVKVLQGYGLSETTNFSLTFPPEANSEVYEKMMLEHDPPSMGAPVFGNEVEVMDPEGDLVGAGNEGEIVVRGWNVMDGYLNRPQKNEGAFRGGWFHTGDKGFYRQVEGEKYFFHLGRLGEVINYQGEVISLQEIDRIVQTLEGLEKAYAVGYVTDDGEKLGLYVVETELTPSKDKIKLNCQEVLPSKKVPSRIVIGDEPPRTSTGKIKRDKLKTYFGTN